MQFDSMKKRVEMIPFPISRLLFAKHSSDIIRILMRLTFYRRISCIEKSAAQISSAQVFFAKELPLRYQTGFGN